MPSRAEHTVGDAIGRQHILGHTLAALIEFQPVRIFEHVHLLAAGAGHPVIVAVEGGVAILIGVPFMHQVRSGKMRRQLHQVMALVVERLGRNQPALGDRPLFHAHGGPLEGRLVQIFQTLEAPPRKKVRLHRPEAAFLASFAVGMILFVTHEAESILFGEGLHLRRHHRVPARAA
jgi:hypothetical protein